MPFIVFYGSIGNVSNLSDTDCFDNVFFKDNSIITLLNVILRTSGLCRKITNIITNYKQKNKYIELLNRLGRPFFSDAANYPWQSKPHSVCILSLNGWKFYNKYIFNLF